MQDQGKRLLLAVVLAAGILLVWNQFFHKEEPPPRPTAGQTAGSGQAAAPSEPLLTVPIGPRAGGPAAEGAPVAAATIHLESPQFAATFSSACGGLTSWHLTDKRYERDATRGELLPARSQMTVTDASGKQVPPSPAELASVPACGAFEVNFATGSTYDVPRNAEWKGEKLSAKEVRYTFANDQLEIVKDFTLVPEDYLVRMALRVNVRVPEGQEAHEMLAVTSYAYQDPAELKNGSSRIAARAWSSSTLRDDTIVTTDVAGVIESSRFEPSRGSKGPLR